MKIALLGFGNVGRGAYETLQLLPEIEVKRVLVRNVRPCGTSAVTADFSEILNDPEIELVAEVMGGFEPARSYVLAALRAKKHVVSANKELLCKSFSELTSAAFENGVCLRYTACAGGGIPWLFNLERDARCGEIEALGGIMNGTTNFMLHAMQQSGIGFDEALKRAQSLGYVEAEPSADVDGCDAARKCAMSANLAFHTMLKEAEMNVEGIRRVRPCDIEFAKSRNCVLKLIARAHRANDAVNAYVEPCFVKASSQEAQVPGNYNLFTLEGKRLKRQSFFGQGAGMYPTGIAVAQDILDVARGSVKPQKTVIAPQSVDNQSCAHRYYVRCGAQQPHEGLMELACERLVTAEGCVYITKPVSVFAMHALAQTLRKADPQLFFAGMEEA